jgi:hypothetical protein
MSDQGVRRANDLLSGLIGREISSLVKGEFQFRLLFGEDASFITDSPWRLLQDGTFLIAGIADPSQTGYRQSSHRRSKAFDIIELNGIPLSAPAEHDNLRTLLQTIQSVMRQRGASEVYGPAGIFQNGSEVLVPALQSQFTRHLHVALDPRRKKP